MSHPPLDYVAIIVNNNKTFKKVSKRISVAYNNVHLFLAHVNVLLQSQ